MRIVLVDDERLIVEGLKKTIGRKYPEMDISAFTGPADVPNEIKARLPELLITDIRMPGMTGLELIAACRKLGDAARRLAEEGVVMHVDPSLRDAFSFVLWRLARMAQMRGYDADQKGLRREAIREATVADELDDVNPSVAGLRDSRMWQSRQNFGVAFWLVGGEAYAREDFAAKVGVKRYI